MALTGTLLQAAAQFRLDGTTTLNYTINIEDDVLGVVGSRGYTVDDPAVVANVLAYVTQMLPMIEAQTGIPVALPVAPPAPPDVEE